MHKDHKNECETDLKLNIDVMSKACSSEYNVQKPSD